jgi:hypothetical protein
MELAAGAIKLTSILNRLFAVSGHGASSNRALFPAWPKAWK